MTFGGEREGEREETLLEGLKLVGGLCCLEFVGGVGGKGLQLRLCFICCACWHRILGEERTRWLRNEQNVGGG